MKSTSRFFLNFLAPPAIATGLLAGGTLLFTLPPVLSDSFMAVLGSAYFFAGGPSAVHAAVLDRAYQRGWSPCGERAILLSTANGLLVGVAIGWLVAAGQSERFLSPTVGIFSALGAVTGALNALLHHALKFRNDDE